MPQYLGKFQRLTSNIPLLLGLQLKLLGPSSRLDCFESYQSSALIYSFASRSRQSVIPAPTQTNKFWLSYIVVPREIRL